MASIFISYRRDDTAGYAGRLYDILSAHFGKGEVFIDVDEIPAGQDFAKVIEETEARCSVLLVVIGKAWLLNQAEDGRPRLFDPQDFVRLEIEAGLGKNLRVIPLLVGGAVMPRAQQLPEELSALSRLEAFQLEDTRFRRDVEQLIGLLEAIVPVKDHKDALSGQQEPNRNRSRKFLIALCAAIAIALLISWAALPKARRSVIPALQISASPRPAQIQGTWEATVKYQWGDTYKELFKFETNGSTLGGTASYLGGGRGDRGILDGKIHGNEISFVTKSYSEIDDKTYEEKHYYLGAVSRDQIRFTLQTDSGYDSELPQRFVATRVTGK